MQIKEIVTLNDGREVTIHMTEDEHRALMDFAVNTFIREGWIGLSQVEGEQSFIDVEEVLKNTEGDA